MRKVIKTIFNPGTNSAFAIISFCLAIIPENLFTSMKINKDWSDDVCIIVNRLIPGVIIIIIANLIYWLYHHCRKQVSIDGRYYKIQIEYKDIMKIKTGKVLINFDECFTSVVGNSPEQIRDYSVCGQFLAKNPGIDVKKMAKEKGIMPAERKSKYLEKDRYESGTIVPYQNYFLLAFTTLDERGRAYMTYEDYIECLNRMWKEIDRYNDNQDVYIPVLGSKIVRLDKDLTQQEILDTIIDSYKLNQYKLQLPNKLHIVCNKADKNKCLSLSKIFGVD